MGIFLVVSTAVLQRVLCLYASGTTLDAVAFYGLFESFSYLSAIYCFYQ